MIVSEQRITTKDVDYDEDLRCYYGGTPVTGPVWEYAPDGRLITVVHYHDGTEDGPARLYYPDGKMRAEKWYKLGVIERARWWYPNGQLSREKQMDRGRLVSERAWTDDGTEVDRARRDCD
jgi:antitoxin component YwqK of YwqJK toxin-antitoxin module